MLVLTAVQPVCLLGILAAAGLGFLIGSRGDSGPSAYLARENAVLAARYYSNVRPRRWLPTLPRSIFCASLFLTILLLRGWSPHLPLFSLLSLASTLSSGTWLLIASNFQRSADEQRQARIDEFVDNPDCPVPPPVAGLETLPWLENWRRFNVAVFVLLIAVVVLWPTMR